MARRATVRRATRPASLVFRMATAPARLLPTFLVVGAKRSGSTSLFNYLLRHRSISGPLAPKGSHFFDVNYGRGWWWYRSQFPLPGRQRITGEASPYYMFHPLAADRIAAALPHIRLIAILRNPVDRAYSHHQYERARGLEDLPFEQAIDREPARLDGEFERMIAVPGYDSTHVRHHAYLRRGQYAEQLDTLYRLVPPARVLVVQSEALFADPQSTLDRVFGFLGLSPAVVGGFPVLNQGRYDPMPDALRRRLEDHFKVWNDRLYRCPGVDFRWSSQPASKS